MLFGFFLCSLILLLGRPLIQEIIEKNIHTRKDCENIHSFQEVRKKKSLETVSLEHVRNMRVNSLETIPEGLVTCTKLMSNF